MDISTSVKIYNSFRQFLFLLFGLLFGSSTIMFITNMGFFNLGTIICFLMAVICFLRAWRYSNPISASTRKPRRR